LNAGTSTESSGQIHISKVTEAKKRSRVICLRLKGNFIALNMYSCHVTQVAVVGNLWLTASHEIPGSNLHCG